MKKLLYLLALAVVAFSCAKETPVNPDSNSVQIIVNAGSPETKSFIDYDDESDKYISKWNNGDELGILVNNWSSSTTVFPSKLSNDSEDGLYASFKGTLPNVNVGENTFYGICPASCLGKFYSGKEIGLDIPATQTSTNDTFDPKSDILVSKPKVVTTTAGQKSITIDDMQFTRLSSIAKLVFYDNNSGVDLSEDKVKSITVSLPDDITSYYLAGRLCYSYYDFSLADGVMNGTGKRSITVSAATPYCLNNTKAAFISVNRGTIPAGTQLTFQILTDRHNITKVITVANPIEFREGKMTVLRVGITSNCTIKEIAQEPKTEGWFKVLDKDWLSAGDIVVLGSAGDNNNDKAVGSLNGTYFKVANIEVSQDGKSISDPASEVSRFELCDGTATGSFAFKTGDKYVTYSGNGSRADVSLSEATSNEGSWKVSIDANAVATLKIAAGDHTAYLFQHNTTGRFAAYKNTQKNLFIYKYYSGAPKAATPTLSYSNGTVTISSTTPDASIYYTTNGDEPTESSTLYTEPFEVSAGTTIKAVANAVEHSLSLVATMAPAELPVISCEKNSVSISGSDIKYSVNESAPSTYTSSFTVPFGAIVKAFACPSDKPASLNAVMNPCSAPVISQEGNIVTISADGSTIFYTTDGNDVAYVGEGYSNATSFTLTENVTVKAVAIRSNATPSTQTEVACEYHAIPTIVVSDVADITCLGTQDGESTYEINNFVGSDDVTVKAFTGCVSYATAGDGIVMFTVSPNYATTEASGTIVLRSESNDTEATINVTQNASVYVVTAANPVSIAATANATGTFVIKSSFAGTLQLSGTNASDFTLSSTTFEANTTSGVTVTITAKSAGASSVRNASVIVKRDGQEGTTTVNIQQAAGARTYAYTFNNKSWTSSCDQTGAPTWSGNKDGSQYNSSQTPKGVQVLTAQNGVQVTSSDSFTSVSKITITYNSSKNAVGSIVVKVGNTTIDTKSVGKSKTGEVLTFTPSSPITGKVQFICNVTTNSYAIEKIAVTAN